MVPAWGGGGGGVWSWSIPLGGLGRAVFGGGGREQSVSGSQGDLKLVCCCWVG